MNGKTVQNTFIPEVSAPDGSIKVLETPFYGQKSDHKI
jgi:hypothetical protein